MSARSIAFTRIFQFGSRAESVPEEVNGDSCLEYNKSGDDADILKAPAEITGGENPFALQTFEKSRRDAVLHEWKERGFSVRCLSRLTGINRNIIQRA